MSTQSLDATDPAISSMDLTERVIWLQRRGISDEQILQALLDANDPQLVNYARDIAAVETNRAAQEGVDHTDS